MRHTLRLPVLILAVIAGASTFALHASARPALDGNRFEAHFTEAAASITNRVADLGIFQLINTGSGTVQGFGDASVVVGITQDRSVTPCGPGSWTNAATRRIVLDGGVLVLRELTYRCPANAPAELTGTYEVDGASSTGVFAGARGTGEIAVNPAAHMSVLSGKLKLAGSEGG